MKMNSFFNAILNSQDPVQLKVTHKAVHTTQTNVRHLTVKDANFSYAQMDSINLTSAITMQHSNTANATQSCIKFISPFIFWWVITVNLPDILRHWCSWHGMTALMLKHKRSPQCQRQSCGLTLTVHVMLLFWQNFRDHRCGMPLLVFLDLVSLQLSLLSFLQLPL